jgi:hypothetical protein
MEGVMSNATELLRRAEECLRHAEHPNDYREEESDELRDDIIAYLATEKEAEPVTFLCDATRFKVTGSKAEGMIYGLPQNLIGKWVAFVDADNGQHLRYTKPEPARKALPPEKRMEGYIAFEQEQSSANLMSFLAGISWAEKSYEVKGSDE